MASGDTKTQEYLNLAATGTRADLPAARGCCNTRTQDLIVDVADRIITEEETRAREDAILQGEIDEIKNNPDVFDIVATYADLQNYDTSTITDKDVVRVLRDETHNNASTYYRWDAADQEFDYIGETGDYYTKAQVDVLLDGKQDELTAGDNITIVDESGSLVISAEGGGITELTSADYDYPTNNPDGVAIWNLNAGIYTRASSVKVYLSTNTVADSQYTEFILTPAETSGGTPVMGVAYLSRSNPLVSYANVNTNGSMIGSTTSFLTRGSIVQSTGTSTNSVMSQNAVTSMVYADPSTKQKVQISGFASGTAAIAIGNSADANQNYAISIGSIATAQNGATYSIALGAGAETTAKGQMDISTARLGNNGYNSSQYRLLTGLYDPQSAHDAATKGYVDSHSGGAPLTDTQFNTLWEEA